MKTFLPITLANVPAGYRAIALPSLTAADEPASAPTFDVFEVWYGGGRAVPTRLLHAAECTLESAEKIAQDLRDIYGDCPGVCVVVEPSACDDFALIPIASMEAN